MKHLKSSLSDLRQIFEGNINVGHLAEPFVSFDGWSRAEVVRSFMSPDRKDYDVVGVRENGLIRGYVKREDLIAGDLKDYRRKFEKKLVLDESEKIKVALRLLCDPPHRVYVKLRGRVSGIVTKGDLQKVPVRMWLFGLISLLEMQFLRLIREGWPNESWNTPATIKPNRVSKAQEILDARKRHHEAIDLADCLQFCDKGGIVLNNDKLRTRLCFDLKKSHKEFLKQLRDLRDELDHAQDILGGRWRDLSKLVDEAEKILDRAEKIDAETAKKLCAPPD